MDALEHFDWQERWHPHICVDCLDDYRCCGKECAGCKYGICAGCAGDRERDCFIEISEEVIGWLQP